MKPEKMKIVNPCPYFLIDFSCGNRAFYQVFNKLEEIANDLGIEEIGEYFWYSCDYEGDLDKITIYDTNYSKEFIGKFCEFYEIDKSLIPEDMEIILEC